MAAPIYEIGLLRTKVWQLWCDGQDTKTIAEDVGQPEHVCERVINRFLDLKRINTLKGRQA